MNPVAIIRGALEAIGAEDKPHRDIMLNAVRAELDTMQGGCPCEQRLHHATCLPDDEGEAAKMLLRTVHRDLQAVARFSGNHGPGFGGGLAVISEMAERLAGQCDETESD
jgi:hypothetical protein